MAKSDEQSSLSKIMEAAAKTTESGKSIINSATRILETYIFERRTIWR